MSVQGGELYYGVCQRSLVKKEKRLWEEWTIAYVPSKQHHVGTCLHSSPPVHWSPRDKCQILKAKHKNSAHIVILLQTE